MNPPTPWPPDMATGENPPDGAMIDYYIGPNFSGAVTLEVVDSKGEVVATLQQHRSGAAARSALSRPDALGAAPARGLS